MSSMGRRDWRSSVIIRRRRVNKNTTKGAKDVLNTTLKMGWG